jgi:hypothetical protein
MTMTEQEREALLERCSEEIAQMEAINAGESEGCIVVEVPDDAGPR